MVVAKATMKPDTSLNNLVVVAGAAAAKRMAAGITKAHAMGTTVLSKPLRDVALAWVNMLVEVPRIQRLATIAVSITNRVI